MATINRNGVTIFYEAHGAGPTILLSHGYSATAAMWNPQVKDLSRDFRIVVWDMRGHGDSDSPDDATLYSEAATVADMAAILDVVGARSAVIGGLSLGGYMSLAFELVHPARTSALMVFDTGPGYRSDNGRDGWNRTARARADQFERDGLNALGTGNEVRVSQHRSAKGLAHAARGMLAQVDGRVINHLPDIRVPTLVLVGENDTPFIAATDYMAGKIPGAKKVVLKDAGHASNIDQPNAFNDAVRTFIRDSNVK
jgi:pimeloyl-ACP methyl ester carboxylesterase